MRIRLRLLSIGLILTSCAISGVAANRLSAQELWGRGVVPGQISFTTGGVFESADQYLGDGSGSVPLEGVWTTPNAAMLFPGSSVLRDALAAASGLSEWTGNAGTLTGTAQVSRETFPVELRVGVIDRLTVGARITSRRDRVEAVFRMMPSEGIDLGVNPLVGGATAVQDFLDAVDAAVAALPSPGAWTDFASNLRSAYLASTLFPIAGSEVADALSTRLSELDPGLAASLPLATTPLDRDELERALTAGDGLYRYLPFGERLLNWNPGDVDVWADYQLVREGTLSTVDGHGVSLRAGARLPFGTPDNPNLHFDAGSGDGQLDILASADGWLRRERWGVSGGLDLVIPAGSTARGVRLVDGTAPLSPAIWFIATEWTPGSETRLRFFPSLSPASGLWFDAGYVFTTQGDGTFETGELGPGVPDPSIYAGRTGWSRHELVFGLRYRPPSLDDGRVEVWSRWSGSFSGEGPETPAWTTLELGGRIWRTLW